MMNLSALLSLFICLPSSLQAASDGHALNYYSIILGWFGIHLEGAFQLEWLAVPGSLLTMLLIFFFGVRYKKYVASFETDATPDGKWSLSFFLHGVVEYVNGLAKDIIGHGGKQHLPLLVTIFLFVLLGNLAGMIPGLGSPTAFISANLAMGLAVFVVYNLAGVREHGGSYIKQFTGPFLWLAPMFLVIELISHAARPASLAVRLLINVFADHMILDIFTDLTYLLVPVLFLFFGLLVAFVQSFVFTLLSSIYISMAVSHDH